jgi:hypothetical protein
METSTLRPKAGGPLSRRDRHHHARCAPPVTPAGFALPGAIHHNAPNVNFAPGSSEPVNWNAGVDRLWRFGAVLYACASDQRAKAVNARRFVS